MANHGATSTALPQSEGKLVLGLNERHEESYPLTPLQKGLLFEGLRGITYGAYVTQPLLTLRGAIDRRVMAAAWEELVALLPVLRTVFVGPETTTGYQAVLRHAERPLRWLDLGDLRPEQQETQLAGLLDEERHRCAYLCDQPPLSMVLIRYGEHRHQLLFSHHHALLDGWSFYAIFERLVALYEGRRAGERVTLPAVVPYAAYVEWQQARPMAEAEAFWRERLAGVGGKTVVPMLIRGRIPAEHTAPHSQLCRFHDDLYRRLKELAHAQRVTLTALVQTAVALLLWRYTGQRDVVVGAVTTGRLGSDVSARTALGLLVNTLPLRITIEPSEALTALTARVRDDLLALRGRVHDGLSDIQRWAGATDGLFDVICGFDGLTLKGVRAAARSIEVERLESIESPAAALGFAWKGDEEALVCRLFHRPDRYDDAAARGMLAQLEHLLGCFCTDPQRPVGTLPLLTDALRDRQLQHALGPCVRYEIAPNVAAAFSDQVRARPEATALVCDDRILTYGELEREAEGVAELLRARGVCPGELVALLCGRSWRMVAGILGILKAGAAYLPIDPDYPTEHIAILLEDSDARLLLTDGLRTVSGIDTARVAALTEATPVAAISTPPITPDHLAYVIYTSGSTGRPKGVLLSHRGVLNLAAVARERLGLDQRDRVVQFATIAFDSSVWEIFSALLNGASLYLTSRELLKDPEEFHCYGAEHGITCATLPPAFLAHIDPARLTGLRVLVSAGAELPRELAERWRERVALFNGYGPTEATVGITFWVAQPVVGRAAPIGRPWQNSAVYVLDEQLEPQPIGVPGEVFVTGPGLAWGYLGAPSFTAERFVPNPFARHPGERLYRTGDLARLCPDSQIEFIGRCDHQVKIRGFRVEPAEIEAALRACHGVDDAVVTVLESPGLPPRLVAYYGTTTDLDADTVRERLTALLPSHMIPALLVPLARLPLTVNGKVDRARLPVAELVATESDEMPADAVEQQLIAIWQRVLHCKRIGVQDNFFSLGGDSIISIQVVSQAAEAGYTLRVQDLFDCPTPRQLAGRCRQQRGTFHTPQQRVIGEQLLTPIQHWFFEQRLQLPHHWNQSQWLRLPPDVDEAIAADWLARLAAHHDALRLRFALTADGRWQARYGEVAAAAPAIARHDLTALPATERAAAMAELTVRVESSLSLERGPLMAAALVDLPGERRLLLTLHHLVVDTVSWRILLEDLNRLEAQWRRGETPALRAKTTSYQHWSRRLAEYAADPAVQAELAWWTRPQLAGYRPPAAFAVQDPAANTVASAVSVDVTLAAEITRALLEQVPAVYNTRIDDLLLCALARAWKRWSGAGALRVDVERHGREPLFEEVDLTRTVGWFTSVFPLIIEVEGGAPGRDLLGVKEQLRAIPQRGVSYGILRYLSPSDAVRELVAQLPAAPIAFNYLGRYDTSAAAVVACEGGIRLARDPAERRVNPIDILAWIESGRLTFQLHYSRSAQEETAMTRLAALLLAELEQLIAHCLAQESGARSPSDFPLAGVDEGQLAQVLDELDLRDHPHRVEALYPLSPLQQGLLVESLKRPGSGIYVNQALLSLRGAVEPMLLEKAWQVLLREVPVLRTIFSYERGGQALQAVLTEVPFMLRQLDFSTLAESARQAELASLIEHERLIKRDFRTAPFSSLVLVKLAPGEWRLLWTHHHLLMDGWSLPPLLRALGNIYTALARREPLPAPTLVPYENYIRWLLSQSQEAAERFWRDRLASYTPISLGLARDEDQSDEAYGSHELVVEEATHGAWAAAARRHRVTLNTLVQAALALLLARYYGRDDMVIGMAVSGRDAPLPGVERVVGLLTNTLPLRLRIRPAQSLGQLLASIMDDAGEATRHGRVGLAEIKRLVGIEASAELFEVVVAFENYPQLPPSESALDVVAVEALERPHLPLTLAFIPGMSFRVVATYQRRRFQKGEVERLLARLFRILDRITAGYDGSVAELPWLPEAERSALAKVSVNPRHYPPGQTVFHLFARQARLTPEAVALVGDDGELGYKALDHAVGQLAGRLQGAVQPGAVIGICMERSASMVVATLAALRMGAAYLPLDPALPHERVVALVTETQPALILVDATGAERLGALAFAQQRIDLPTLLASEAAVPPIRALRDGLAYVLYTSGSTGRPKGVMVPNSALYNHMQWLVDRFPLSASDRVLMRTPFHFDASVWELFAPLITGATLVLLPPEGRNDMLLLKRTLRERDVTVLQMVPSLLKLLLEEEGLRDCPTLTRIFCGGEALGVDVKQQVEAQSNAELCNLYGPTECTIDAAYWTCRRGEARRHIPLGRPVGNVSLHLLDQWLDPLPEGLEGELYIGGDCVAWGYFGNPRLTAERFLPDALAERPGARLYRSGDLARRDDDGSLIFLGRNDHQVKIRGNRIELGEIESHLKRHEGVSDALVVTQTAADGRQQLVAYFIAAGGTAISATAMQIRLIRSQVDAEQLRHHLSAALPDYMVPTHFIPLEAWPLTPNGKVDRAALPAPMPGGGEETAAPATEAERVLVGIWEEVLKLDSIGVTDNFFELGGDSILSIQVASRARKAGLRIGVKEIFAHATIRELARHCGEGAAAAVASQEAMSGEQILLPAQRWFFAQSFRHPHHWNQSLLLALPADPGVEATGAMLGTLVRQHDALRLRFDTSVTPPRTWYGDEAGSWALGEQILPADPVVHSDTRSRACRAAQAGLSLNNGPLLRGLLLRTPGRSEVYLFLSLHHLVSDAVSLRILIEDLAHCYRAWQAGRRPALPAKTTSMQHWGQRLREYAASPKVQRQVDYWSRPALSRGAPVPTDYSAEGSDSAGTMNVVSVMLERDATRQLLERANDAYGTRIDELLLCALVRAYRAWCGQSDLLVELEGHGREHLFDEVDLARTVGWFTSAYPVPLSSAGDSPGDDIRSVKETLRSVPEKGIGYGLLTHFGDQVLLPATAQPRISFNYLGQFDQSWGADTPFQVLDGIAEMETDPREKRTHLIDVVGKVRDGRLTVIFIYSAARYRERTIAALADAYLAALRAVIEHCLTAGSGIQTPSDFPLAGVTETTLADLLAEVGTRQSQLN